MSLKPHDWSVIIAGRWNRAILTPQGIATRLFKLPAETPVEVEVPLDALGPYRVSHNRITVTAGWQHLVIEPRDQTYERLAEAMKIGQFAIEDLPETPLSAVGINIRYRSEESIEVLEGIIGHSWDEAISDNSFVIQNRTTARTLRWKDGVINLTVNGDDSGVQLLMNIERRSSASVEHLNWLRLPTEEIQGVVRRILVDTIHLSAEEIEDGQTA